MTAPTRSLRLRAIADSVPLVVPVLPFALVLGVAMTESAMPLGVAYSSNFVVFAGAAQLATVTLAATASWLTLVLTAAVINLRHVMYSAALAPRFGAQPTWFRWVSPFLLTDQAFAIAQAAEDLEADDWRRYLLTMQVFFYSMWACFVGLGVGFGSAIPSAWRLDVAPSVMFAGLVVLGIAGRPAIVASVTSIVVTLACLEVPNSGGVLIGASAGILAGYLADRGRA